MQIVPGVGDGVGAILIVGVAVARGVGLIVGPQEPPVLEGGWPLNRRPTVRSYSTLSDRLHAFMMNTVHVPVPDSDARSTSSRA